MLGIMASKTEPNVDSPDFYARLGVSREATPQDIKKAFRELARSHHPDRAGLDSEASERFKRVREAYETLSDPKKRQRYDHRGQNRPGVNAFRWTSEASGGNQDHRASFADDLDLDDIFSDRLKGGIFRGNAGQADTGPDFGFGGRESPKPQHGSDVVLVVEISQGLAEMGGSQTLEYVRLVHSEDRRGLRRQSEIFDLRLGPGNSHGDSVRIPKMGNVGLYGGSTGDLICDLIVRTAEAAEPVDPNPRVSDAPVDHVLHLTIQQALLGDRVQVRCPGGLVSVVVPPCSSSGQRLRIAGKGERRKSGERGDHELRIEIVCPTALDDESRSLIRQFADRNSYDPKEGHES